MHQQATPASVNPGANQRFLEMLFGPDWSNATVVSVADLDHQPNWTAYRAEGVLEHFPPGANNYYTVSLFDQPTLRRKAGFREMVVLALDDVGSKVDPARVRAALGEPLYRLETSPGSEHWGYRLRPRVTDERRATRLTQRVVVGLCGGKDPGMGGVNRVMRLPEGTNTKTEVRKKVGPGGWVCKLWLNPTPGDLDPAAVEQALPMAGDDASIDPTTNPDDLGDPVLGPGPVGPLRSGSSGSSGSRRPADPVLRALRKLGMIKDGPRQSAGGTGWDIVCPWNAEHSPTAAADTGTFYFQGGGFKCWHGHCDNKHPDDVRRRMDELLRADSGGLLGLDDLDPARLDPVDPATVPASPVMVGPEPVMVTRFWAEHVLLTQEDRFVDLNRGTLLGDKVFDGAWRGRLQGLTPMIGKRYMTPGEWFRAEAEARGRAMDGRAWWPGQPEVFTAAVEGKRQRLLNTWLDLDRPLAGVSVQDLDRYVRTSPWADLIRTLFDAATARHMLDYLSMVVGPVDVKPGHNPLIQGPQGAGKEIVFTPVIQVLGPARHQQIDQEALNSQFTDWVKHRLVTLPEVRRTTRGTLTDHDMYQRIKALCDPGKDFLRLNEKYRLPVAARNLFVLVMTSNEDRPMTLPADDRRIWVIQVEMPNGWDLARFQDLALWYDRPDPWGLATNSHAIVEWLIRRWDPNTMLGRVLGHAPMTEAKRMLTHLGRSDAEVWVETLLTLTSPDPLALPDLFTSLDVLNKLDEASRTGGQGLPRGTKVPGITAVGRMLNGLGCLALNSQQSLRMPQGAAGGTRQRVWAKPGDIGRLSLTTRQIEDWLAANRRT